MFSLAGHKRGFEDARGTSFFDVARIIKKHRLKIVFCENVKKILLIMTGITYRYYS